MSAAGATRGVGRGVVVAGVFRWVSGWATGSGAQGMAAVLGGQGVLGPPKTTQGLERKARIDDNLDVRALEQIDEAYLALGSVNSTYDHSQQGIVYADAGGPTQSNGRGSSSFSFSRAVAGRAACHSSTRPLFSVS